MSICDFYIYGNLYIKIISVDQVYDK
jgi:hypothetical protein